ncbi:MAG: NADP(H)-dependent aldo-keto reductase [Flavobacteriaceae bacterium]|nr:MAG: NADP(H)-dependent aldo-keto reductase [Flavobacteriaceae bacterium]
MKYNTLPGTEISISEICLGTMTFGEQNNESEGHKQLDYALEHGINFIDTAELYSVPASAATYGSTETIIGTWLKKSGKRKQVVLASKISGPGEYAAHIRSTGFTKQAVTEALHGSLKRLQTSYLDLYQLHWPTRPANYFGVRNYVHSEAALQEDNFLTVLETLNDFVKAGKIRQIGISNETAWGTMRYLNEAEKHHLPRMKTIQNPYSLLNRTFEGALAEVAMQEQVGLLAYSPLAFGVLSGKYRNGQTPEKGRVTLYPRFDRYSNEQCVKAVNLYYALALENNLTLTELSLAFVRQKPWVSSTIIGATTIDQLKENIATTEIILGPSLLKGIDAINSEIPNPAP